MFDIIDDAILKYSEGKNHICSLKGAFKKLQGICDDQIYYKIKPLFLVDESSSKFVDS